MEDAWKRFNLLPAIWFFMKRNIFLKLREILENRFLVHFRSFSAYDKLQEDIGLSPMELAELIWYLENQYNIYIPDSEIKNLVTLKDVVRCIDENLQHSTFYPLYLAQAV